MKSLGLNLTSDVQNGYSETHNTLLSETREIKSRVIALCSWLEDSLWLRCEHSV